MQRYIFSSTLTSSKLNGCAFYTSSAKYVNTFRTALTRKQGYSLNENIAEDVNFLFYHHPPTLKTSSF